MPYIETGEGCLVFREGEETGVPPHNDWNFRVSPI
jgi:hypothetical protein